MGQSRPLFCFYCRSFLVTISIQIEKSKDGVLGIWTRGHRMVGADETTELWRPPNILLMFTLPSINLFSNFWFSVLLRNPRIPDQVRLGGEHKRSHNHDAWVRIRHLDHENRHLGCLKQRRSRQSHHRRRVRQPQSRPNLSSGTDSIKRFVVAISSFNYLPI